MKFNRFLLGSSLIVLAAAPALAQATNNSDVEEVVVTGTSIRGVQPVGSNLISVNREDLDKTNVQSMQQIYKTIPALSNMGALPQGNQSGNAYYAPTIHNLGSSSSNSTLVLIDGHLFPWVASNNRYPIQVLCRPTLSNGLKFWPMARLRFTARMLSRAW